MSGDERNKLKIVPASEVGVSFSHNTLLVNDYQGTVRLQHYLTDPHVKSNLPLSKLNHQQLSYTLDTGNAAIVLNESNLYYSVKFDFQFQKPGIVKLINGIWWFQEYTMPSTEGQAAVKKGDWIAVCTGPRSSLALLDSTEVGCSGMTHTTRELLKSSNYYLKKISSEMARSDSDVWFMGDLENDGYIQIDGRPYKNESGTKKFIASSESTFTGLSKEFTMIGWDDIVVSKQFLFRVPLPYLSDVFMQDHGLLYLNAVNGQSLAIKLVLSQWGVAEQFSCPSKAKTTWGLKETSSLLDCFMDIYSKDSRLLQSDARSSDVIVNKCIGRSSATINVGNNYSRQSHQILERRSSLNDIMFCVQPVDLDQADSIQRHGLTTTYKSAEVLKIINDKSVSANYNYFSDFQLWDNTNSILFNSGGINTLNQYKNLTLCGLGVNNNYYAHPDNTLGNQMWQLTSSEFIVCLEAFRADFGPRDTIYDGIDTRGSETKLQFAFANYDPSSTLLQPAQTKLNDGSCYQTIGQLAVDVHVFYDCFMVILPKQNKMVFTEEIAKYQ